MQSAKQSKLTTNTQNRAKTRNASKIYRSVISTAPNTQSTPWASFGTDNHLELTRAVTVLVAEFSLIPILETDSLWTHMRHRRQPCLAGSDCLLSLRRLVQTPSSLGQSLKLIFGDYLFCLKIKILKKTVGHLPASERRRAFGHACGGLFGCPPMYEICQSVVPQGL